MNMGVTLKSHLFKTNFVAYLPKMILYNESSVRNKTIFLFLTENIILEFSEWYKIYGTDIISKNLPSTPDSLYTNKTKHAFKII